MKKIFIHTISTLLLLTLFNSLSFASLSEIQTGIRKGTVPTITYEENVGEIILAPFIEIRLPLQTTHEGTKFDIGPIPFKLNFSKYFFKIDFFDFDMSDAYLGRIISLEAGFGKKTTSYLTAYFILGSDYLLREQTSDSQIIGLNFRFKIGSARIYFNAFTDLSAMDTHTHTLCCGFIFNL